MQPHATALEDRPFCFGQNGGRIGGSLLRESNRLRAIEPRTGPGPLAVERGTVPGAARLRGAGPVAVPARPSPDRRTAVRLRRTRDVASQGSRRGGPPPLQPRQQLSRTGRSPVRRPTPEQAPASRQTPRRSTVTVPEQTPAADNVPLRNQTPTPAQTPSRPQAPVPDPQKVAEQQSTRCTGFRDGGASAAQARNEAASRGRAPATRTGSDAIPFAGDGLQRPWPNHRDAANNPASRALPSRALPVAPSPVAGSPVAPAQQAALAGPDPNWLATVSAWLQAHRSYPETARQLRQQGTVVGRITVNPEGHVMDVNLLTGGGSENRSTRPPRPWCATPACPPSRPI